MNELNVSGHKVSGYRPARSKERIMHAYVVLKRVICVRPETFVRPGLLLRQKRYVCYLDSRFVVCLIRNTVNSTSRWHVNRFRGIL